MNMSVKNSTPDSRDSATTIGHITRLAVTYTFGDIFAKGLNYLLLPLYLQHLPPEEFGILAITEVLKAILGLLFSFGMTGAILRFIHVVEEKELPSFFGSMWVFLILSAGSVTLFLLIFGSSLFQILIPNVKFEPFLQKTILTAFLNSSFALLPTTMFRARDQVKNYVLFGLFSTVFMTAATILHVVVLKQEAAGWVQAQLEGAVLVALVSFIILLRKVKPSFRWETLKPALFFSIPLIPHFVAHWILSVSDRMIIESYVGLAQLGLYTLGYQFGQGFQVIVTGLNNAMIPMFGRASRERSERLKLPDMITYYLLIVTTFALFFALIGGDIILLLFPSNYDEAVPLVSWIILGFLAFAVYIIPINYLSMTTGKTRLIPFSTLTAALLNLVLNLVFVPQFGIMAAAVNTAIGYGVLALTMLIIARRTDPPPLQYTRIAKLSSCSIFTYIIGHVLLRSSPLTNISIGAGLTLTLPFLLGAIGFWKREEVKYFRRFTDQMVERIGGGKL